MVRSSLPSIQTFPRLSGAGHGVLRRGAGDEQAARHDGNKRRARAANDGKEMAASHHSLPSPKKVIVSNWEPGIVHSLPCVKLKTWFHYLDSFLGHRSLIKIKTQTEVINIVSFLFDALVDALLAVVFCIL